MFVCDGNVNSLYRCACLCKSDQMGITMYECLKICLLKFSLSHLCELLMKGRPLLLVTMKDQNRVFKPRASHLKLLPSKGEHHNFCLNKCVNNFCLLDDVFLNLKQIRCTVIICECKIKSLIPEVALYYLTDSWTLCVIITLTCLVSFLWCRLRSY